MPAIRQDGLLLLQEKDSATGLGLDSSYLGSHSLT
jgi:hypothetical protein